MKKSKKEFSKILLIQESVLIWIVTLVSLALSFVCVLWNFTGAFPWISSVIAVSWGAYGVSQAFYYNKSKAENTKGGVKYASVLSELKTLENTECEYETPSEKIENNPYRI